MNLEKLVRKNIQNMQAYSSARDEFMGVAEIYLDANENALATKNHRYPDPLQHQLKSKIAALKKVKPSQIFLGNGSDEAIDLLFRIFCEPSQDNIIINPPTYGMYQVSAALNDVAVQKVVLLPDYQLDTKVILQKVTSQTKLIFVCSPNNPTGNDMNLESIIFLLKNFDGILIVDEAYIDFSHQKGLLSELENYPNLVVLQTFSKAFGLANIRLGMAFASPEIIAFFNKTKPPYNVNGLTQKVALEALKNIKTKESWVQTLLQQRSWLIQKLHEFSFVKRIVPSSANFILIEFENAQKAYDFLLERQIIVRNRSKQILCNNCLRITVGSERENERLIEVLNNYS